MPSLFRNDSAILNSTPSVIGMDRSILPNFTLESIVFASPVMLLMRLSWVQFLSIQVLVRSFACSQRNLSVFCFSQACSIFLISVSLLLIFLLLVLDLIEIKPLRLSIHSAYVLQWLLFKFLIAWIFLLQLSPAELFEYVSLPHLHLQLSYQNGMERWGYL